MSRPTRRFSLLACSVLAVGALAGALLGSRAEADANRTDDQMWVFGRVLSLVEDQYVGEVDGKTLVEDAIDGLLQTLDPHSNYLRPESFADMRDEQRGKFSGLGIQITKRGPDKPLTIIAPIDDTPAFRAGLLSGDVISEIEGQPTIDMTVHDAVKLLKGEKGTRVNITIERPGDDEPFEVSIERDDIPIESIRVAHMIDDEVGFVRISNFTSTTAGELDHAVADLTEQGMTRLIIDLRNNPGGLLEQAVQVSERFVPQGELIVYTRGRINGANQDYVAKRGVDRVDLPLVVLVNGSSASASEIVSGAIQDHDRGLVVGESTFGKGLVQRVIPLPDGGALAVTTAKYYTPSGRLIQRDYSNLEDYYLHRDGSEDAGDDDDEGADEHGDEGSADRAQPDDREVFYTDAGRKVFGGGGIMPDYVVEAERAPQLLARLIRENLIFDFSVRYGNAHEDLARDFTIDDETFESFRRFLDEREFEFEDAKLDEHRAAVELRLRAQVARIRWGQEAENLVLIEADDQVQRALTLFGEAAELARKSQQRRQTRNDDLRAQAQSEPDGSR
jgi:carboxyl-terminal processing protease